jgi:hypothetical protein
LDALGVSANSFATPAADKQPVIEQKISEYMDLLQTKGLKLPFFGPGKLSLDTRTGFYMFPQVVPKNLVVPLPSDETVGESTADGRQKTTQPYRFLSLPLDTDEAKKRALNYILMFRNAVPAKFMEKYGLEKGFGIRRAMVFDRPPVLPRVFQELDLEVPKEFKAGIARAAALFQKNTGAPRKTGGKIAEQVPTFTTQPYGAYEAGKTPPYGAGTPEFGSTTPEFGVPSRKEAAIANIRSGKITFEELRENPTYNLSDKDFRAIAGMYKELGFSPPFLTKEVENKPPYLAIGGTRKFKKVKKAKDTRRNHKKSLENIAKLFSKVWKSIR